MKKEWGGARGSVAQYKDDGIPETAARMLGRKKLRGETTIRPKGEEGIPNRDGIQ